MFPSDCAASFTEQLKREVIVKTLNSMTQAGLSPVRSGNISVREEGGMLITPTGMAAHELDYNDIVLCSLDGQTPEGARRPSSEWLFHAALYASRPEINAVVHCHSRFATILAAARLKIPAFHYMVAVAGGKEIPLAPYALFGSDALATHVTGTLQGVNACLLANHGQIAVGCSLQQAHELAVEVEELAAQYYHVRLLDQVHLLDDAQMDEVLEKFGSYGQGTGRG